MKTENSDSLIKLALVIINSSVTCAEHFKKTIGEKYGIDSDSATEHWLSVIHEYIFFFLHMTNRMAYDEMGEEKRAQLQDELYPIVQYTTIETLFRSSPNEMKKKLQIEFYENLNRAEMDYGECKELFSKEKPFTSNSLFSNLARHVTELTGYSNNPEVFTQCIEISAKVFSEMNLRELIIAQGNFVKTVK